MAQSDSIDITDIKSPNVYTKDRKLIWKNYMTALDGFKSNIYLHFNLIRG